MPHAVNEIVRGSIALWGICLIVALSGCHLMHSSNHDTVVIGTSESTALASQINQQGIHYVQKNHLLKAESHFLNAIQADSRFGPAYNNLGLVYFHQHDFLNALKNFEKAHAYLPESPEPLNNLGLVMETVARPYEAIDFYWQAHELDPTCAEYLGNLLRARIQNQELDDELLSQLHDLLLYEKRPEWQDWAREQMALLNNPYLDRGPAKPSTEPLNALMDDPSEASSSKSTKSPSSASGSRSSPSGSSRVPDNDLRLPTVIPEELPILDPFLELPSVPSTMVPTPAPQSSLPSPLPPAAGRSRSSVLEPLE